MAKNKNNKMKASQNQYNAEFAQENTAETAGNTTNKAPSEKPSK
ncbi:hypothetical protein [Paenibacillus mendelii]|uniref:Small, acid-soluble spore protein gamma-type n=1 Tax=Paenibacillus mendelii TaxID=206163 RepID=A0ABV6JIJ2_9BACL|nr:hypothetical protein [Paenibacillus mendelii]MCQ6558661.1 hypothetical protein [Paenibacillus mendelii]